jgi:hypothetical protein
MARSTTERSLSTMPPAMPRLRLAAGIAVVTLVFAACGGAASSAAPETAASPTGAADRTPGPSGAPELAAMLPASAGGVDLVTSSVTGDHLAALGVSLNEDVLEALAKDQQLTLADVQVAEARPRDAGTGGLVMAIRVPGADPQAVVEATFSSSNALQLRSLGGKSVYDVAGTGLNVVVYIKDDVMVQVVGAPAELTEAIVAALP